MDDVCIMYNGGSFRTLFIDYFVAQKDLLFYVPHFPI